MEIAFSALQDSPLEQLSMAGDELEPGEPLILTTGPEEEIRDCTIFNARILDVAKILGFEVLDKQKKIPCSTFVELRLKRKPRVHLSVRRKEDYTDFAMAFRKVFNQSMDEGLFHWKYGQGQGSALIARDHSGQLLGHYGFIRRWIHHEGRRVSAFQVCDVFTVQRERGILGRSGSFHQLARLFQTLYLNTPEGAAFAYGFPNPRAMAVAGWGSLYLESDRIFQCRWPREKRPTPRFSFWNMASLDVGDLPENTIEPLWSTMLNALRENLLPERNFSYLKQRYLQHPSQCYRFFLLKARFPFFSDKALLILREDPEATRVMDYIGDPCHFSDAMEALIQKLTEEHPEGPPLLAWVTPGVLKYLKASTLTVEETGISIPVNAYVKTSPFSQIRGRWWVSFGDTDFL